MKCKLADLCKVNQGLQIPISKRHKESGENRYFYITVQFLKNNAENYYIENPPASVLCKKNDILVVRTGNTGQVLTNIEGCFHNNFFKVTPNEKVDSKFLYYSLNNKDMYNKIINAASGTTILDLKHSSFLNLEINLPKIETQRKIADILSSIDLKIQLNNKINDNLQKLSQELFKRWFTDFEFPNEEGMPYKSSGGVMVESELGLIPEVWKVEKLDKIIKFNNGYPFSSKDYVEKGKYKLITIKNVQDEYIDTSKTVFIDNISEKAIKQAKLEINDILISLTGNVGRVGLVVEEDLLLNQRVARIEPLNNEKKPFVYELFTRDQTKKYLIEISKGTAQQNLSPLDALKMKFVNNEEYVIKYSDTIKPFLEKITNNKIETEKLISLRNLLLPKLMNGEIEIKNI